MEPATHLSAITALKNISYVVAFLAGLEYLNLSSTAVLTLAVLLFVDFLTGVLRAGLIDGARSIRSSTGIRGILSKLLVFIVPFILALAGKGSGMDFTSLATSSMAIFIMSTAYSILGNLHSIQSGEPKQEFDALDYIYRKVGAILKKVIVEDEKKV